MVLTSQPARATYPNSTVVAAVFGVRVLVAVMITAVLATLVGNTSTHERPGQVPTEGRTPAVSGHALNGLTGTHAFSVRRTLPRTYTCNFSSPTRSSSLISPVGRKPSPR